MVTITRGFHCVKSVHIRSFSASYFLAYELNTERYSVSLRINSDEGKYGPEKLRIWTLFMQSLSKKNLIFQKADFLESTTPR